MSLLHYTASIPEKHDNFEQISIKSDLGASKNQVSEAVRLSLILYGLQK